MQIAVVTNSLAGDGKGLKISGQIINMLRGKGHEGQIFTEGFWDSDIHAFDQVWIVGGDGTLNYFVNQFHDLKKPICLFAGGTGNDFHAMLYGDVSLSDQVELALRSLPRPIDAGRCNDRYFLNGVGIGFEGSVVKHMAGKTKWPGKTSFLIAILKHILFYKEMSYSIRCMEKTADGDFLMIDVANGKRFGGGFYIAPRAEPNDGLFDVNLVSKLSPWKRIGYLPVIEKGNHLSFPFVDYFHARKIVISSSEIMQAHVDGEYVEGREFVIEMLAGKLEFLC